MRKWKYRKRRLGYNHGGLIKKIRPKYMRLFRGKNWYKYDSVGYDLTSREVDR